MRVFLVAFFQVFLVALQSRNAAQSRYVAGFVTSMGIGATWIFLVKYIGDKNLVTTDALLYVLGNAFGWVCGIYIHKHLSRKKSTDDW